MRLHERRQRLRRLLDALGRIAEHVDDAGRQMRRADAVREHADARAALGEPHGRAQPGDAGAHDRDVVAEVAHCGRWATSNTPW